MVMDVMFMTDGLNSGVDNAQLEIAKYNYDPDVPSHAMEPALVGVYSAAGYSAPGGDVLMNVKNNCMIGSTGLNHNLETGTYRISLILRDQQIGALNAKTLYSLLITGGGGSVQLVPAYLDVITLGASLRLTPDETLEAYMEAYDIQFGLELDIKEIERESGDVPFDRPIMLMINGTPVVTDSPPVIEQGRTLVPVRALVEALGYVASWDPVARTVDIYDPATYDIVISMTIDSDIAYVLDSDGGVMTETVLDAPAMIINGRTMVPARFIAEALGCTVDWDEGVRTVIIGTGT